MRSLFAAAALTLSLGLTVSAQAPNFSTQTSPLQASNMIGRVNTFNGADPRNITFKPVDTGGALRSFNMSGMMPTGMGQQRAPSLTNMFRNFSLPSWPPKLASTPILPQNQNQFQPTLPKGKYTFAPAASQK